MSPLLAQLRRESLHGDVASNWMAEALLVQLFVTLWRDRFARDGQGLSARGRLTRVLEYLRHNCCEPVDLEELAHRFGYSPRHFRRVFREATATTPQDYVLKLRLCRAMHALRRSDASITQVALASGRSRRAGAPLLPLQPAGLGSAHHQLWRGQHQRQALAAGSAGRQRARRAVGQGQRRRSGQHPAAGLCVALSEQAPCPAPALPRPRARGRDGGAVFALHFRSEPRGHLDRHAAAWLLAVRARRSPPSRLGYRAGSRRQRTGGPGRFQRALRPPADLAALEAARV